MFPTSAQRPESGFTLIELLVTLAVLSVLVSLGVPQLRESIRAGQRDAAVHALASDLSFARSEAIKRSSRLSVCVRDDAADGPGCSADAAPEWKRGWLVFTDHGPEAGRLEAAAGERVLRHGAPLRGSLVMTTRARITGGVSPPVARPFVRFDPRGGSNWRGGGTFLVCGTHGVQAQRDRDARALNVSLSGDVRRARRDGAGKLIDAFGTAAACP